MGQELDCRMRYQGAKQVGRLYLETDHLLFRGRIRLKLMFSELTAISAVEGLLRVQFDGGEAAFEVGDRSAKWVDKILHPPSRGAKLGLKAGIKVLLVGDLDDDFEMDLDEAGAKRVKSEPDLIFLAARRRADLESISKLKSKLQNKGAIWIVYPKGIADIRETDVIASGRNNGLKDTKVIAFSNTQTALKFSKV